MALRGNDIAILTARFGCARFGASRFGFIPCPEDVAGSGTDEPGEYIWKEVQPTVTEWTLLGEDCVCRDLCTLALGVITVTPATIIEDVDVTASTTLSGVLGDVDGIARINWGDGRHDESQEMPLVNGAIEFTGHYHVPGNYVITVTVTDERGCEATASLPVTVIAIEPLTADFTIDVIDIGGGVGQMTLTPTVSGGSGNYAYAWTVWTEYTSEGSPNFTSSVEIPVWSPVATACEGKATLTVTDTSTMLTVDVGPKDWTWQCI